MGDSKKSEDTTLLELARFMPEETGESILHGTDYEDVKTHIQLADHVQAILAKRYLFYREYQDKLTRAMKKIDDEYKAIQTVRHNDKIIGGSPSELKEYDTALKKLAAMKLEYMNFNKEVSKILSSIWEALETNKELKTNIEDSSLKKGLTSLGTTYRKDVNITALAAIKALGSGQPKEKKGEDKKYEGKQADNKDRGAGPDDGAKDSEKALIESLEKSN